MNVMDRFSFVPRHWAARQGRREVRGSSARFFEPDASKAVALRRGEGRDDAQILDSCPRYLIAWIAPRTAEVKTSRLSIRPFSTRRSKLSIQRPPSQARGAINFPPLFPLVLYSKSKTYPSPSPHSRTSTHSSSSSISSPLGSVLLLPDAPLVFLRSRSLRSFSVGLRAGERVGGAREREREERERRGGEREERERKC